MPEPVQQTGEPEAGPGAPLPPRLAYLLSVYPAVSHTFFWNEIHALRERGLDIAVASINAPRLARAPSPEEERQIAATYYLKPQARLPALARLAAIALARPATVLRGLRAAAGAGVLNLPAFLYSLLYLAEALLLGDWMRRQGRGHLHVHFGGPVSTVGLLAAQAWRLPFSLTIHGPDEFYDVTRFRLAEKIERADFVVAISDYCRGQLERLVAPAHWGKIAVLRLGVDTARFRPLPPASRPAAPVRILCTGRLVPAKGQGILLSAVARLAREGLPVALTLIGDGPDRAALEQAVREQELGRVVTFTGPLSPEQVGRQLEQADIFALASFAEGLPVALMEAMAMEIPCVSTYIAAIPELIRSGTDGLLVASSSVDELAAALRALVLDPALRRRMGRAAREQVMAHYELGRNMDRLAVAMREKTAAARRRPS